MKIFRSTLLVTATALFAAACGDKVVLPSQNTTTGTNITNVIVAPGSATLTVGQTANLTAAVTADAGVTYTIAWTSSDPTKASVSTTGVVTALVATPGVAICAKATATVGASAQTGCASVIVQGLANPTPASVSIASITGAGGLNFPVPVPPGVVAGQIDVRININPGTVKLDSVTVFINGKNAGSQVLTSAQAAALRSAADIAVAGQAAIPTVIISVNTAAYNATTGAPSFLNGAVTVTAVGFGKQGTIAAAPAASNTVGLLFGNGDAWLVSEVIGATNTANSAAGFAFRTGSIAVSAIPVLYSGQGIASATVNFGTVACDASASAQRTQALAAPATGTFAWTATFSRTAGAAAGVTNVNNYEFNTACASNAGGGEGATVVASQYTNTNVGPVGFVGGSAVPVVRLDNRAPATPAVLANVNNRANGWVNDAVLFTTVNAGAGTNGMIAAAILDAGVGGVVYAAKAGAGTAAVVGATADITSPAGLAMTATNATYCLLQYSVDALGNRSAATPCTAFGVDRVIPVLTVDATSIANGSRFAALPASEFAIAVFDTGLVGNSGMLPTLPVTGTVTMRGASTTAAAACYIGSYAVATGCSPVGLLNFAAGKFNTGVLGTMAAAAGPDYYTFNATAFDAAGNAAVAVPMVTVVDQTGPVVGAASAALSVTALGWPVNAFVNEDLDIQSQWFSGDYATATIAPKRIGQVPTIVSAYNAAVFTNTNYAISQVVNLPFALQANMAATLYAFSGTEANAMSQSNIIVTGAATLPTFPAQTAMALTNWTAFTTPTNSIASNTISSGVATAATVPNPANGTLSVTTTGATAVFNNPFSRVDFYAVNGLGTEFRLIGTTNAITDVDNGVVRTFTYNLPINGLALYNTLGLTATTATNVIAIGFNAAGTVGMFTGAYALTVVK